MTDIERVYIDHFETVYKYVLSLSRDECVADEITQETFFLCVDVVFMVYS